MLKCINFNKFHQYFKCNFLDQKCVNTQIPHIKRNALDNIRLNVSSISSDQAILDVVRLI